MSQQWLTAEQVAHHLQVSVATIWRYTRQGKLQAIKIGNHYRYPLDQVIHALGPGDSPPVNTDLPTPPTSTGHIMTYEEFSRLPEQPGLQLIDGKLVKEPSPIFSHQSCLGTLHLAIGAYVRSKGLGSVIVAPFDIILADDTVLQPDISFVQNNRLPLIQEHGLIGAPDMAIEILSPSTRHYDEGRKKELYLQHGCQELWLVDVQTRSLKQHIAADGQWSAKEFTGEATFEAHTIPGLEITVGDIFE